MPIVIARKRIYRTAAGGTLRVTKEEAAVLKALHLADDPPPPAPVLERPKREYKRRDLLAETAVVQPTLQVQTVPRATLPAKPDK